MVESEPFQPGVHTWRWFSMGSCHGRRRGAAYGLAGIVKGLGISSLNGYGVLAYLTTALDDKVPSLPPSRRPASLAPYLAGFVMHSCWLFPAYVIQAPLVMQVGLLHGSTWPPLGSALVWIQHFDGWPAYSFQKRIIFHPKTITSLPKKKKKKNTHIFLPDAAFVQSLKLPLFSTVVCGHVPAPPFICSSIAAFVQSKGGCSATASSFLAGTLPLMPYLVI